jgi:hypothetical protein
MVDKSRLSYQVDKSAFGGWSPALAHCPGAPHDRPCHRTASEIFSLVRAGDGGLVDKFHLSYTMTVVEDKFLSICTHRGTVWLYHQQTERNKWTQ